VGKKRGGKKNTRQIEGRERKVGTDRVWSNQRPKGGGPDWTGWGAKGLTGSLEKTSWRTVTPVFPFSNPSAGVTGGGCACGRKVSRHGGKDGANQKKNGWNQTVRKGGRGGSLLRG